MQLDPRLKDWATPRQAEFIDAANEHGVMEAARRMGVKHQAVQGAIKAVKKKAAAHGFAPEHGLSSIIPEPFIARGHSTLEKIHGDGSREQVLQWTKTRLDDQQWFEAVQGAIAAFCEGVPQITPPAGPVWVPSTDVIPWVQIGDAHFGMLAQASEVGFDFNLEIAEAEMCGALGMLIDELQPCERLVIQDMGDFTHYDNASKVTERSRHALDTVGTYPDMIRVYSRTMRWMVEKALTKAKHVDVIINQGNHSRSNDWWMAELLKVAFGHTGRVTVLNNDTPFIGYRMGKTMVLCHHSDQVKPKQLADVMTVDFREDYGQTEFHYVDIGHIHHEMVVKQHPSVRVESFNQIARADKYAHDNGYRNRSALTMVLRSKTFGEIGRRTLSIQELQTKMYGAPLRAQRVVHRVA